MWSINDVTFEAIIKQLIDFITHPLQKLSADDSFSSTRQYSMHIDDVISITSSGTENSGSLIKLMLKGKAWRVKLWQFIPDINILAPEFYI
jgi:hypothetical protein